MCLLSPTVQITLHLRRRGGGGGQIIFHSYHNRITTGLEFPVSVALFSQLITVYECMQAQDRTEVICYFFPQICSVVKPLTRLP